MKISKVLFYFGAASAYLLMTGQVVLAAPLFLDEFNNPTLDPAWSVVREDTSHWSLTDNPGSLRITSQQGEFFVGALPKNLFVMDPGADYASFETRLSFSPTADFQQAGLLLYVDDTNFMKFDRIYASNLPGNDVVEFYDRITDTRHTAVQTDNDLYLRITKQGNNYTASHSTDGSVFYDVGTLTAPSLGSAKLGLFAMNGNRSSADIPADFDYFKVNAVPIPAAVWLFCSGLIGLIGMARRKKV